jgi:hypothetical protein
MASRGRQQTVKKALHNCSHSLRGLKPRLILQYLTYGLKPVPFKTGLIQRFPKRKLTRPACVGPLVPDIKGRPTMRMLPLLWCIPQPWDT